MHKNPEDKVHRKIILAYKLMRIKDKGNGYGSLFINKGATHYPSTKWMKAKKHLTDGFAPRVGWHCLEIPLAPHLSTKHPRVWVTVQIKNYRILRRPDRQGGLWFIAEHMRIL